jgi:hypothetical protein
VTEPAHHLGNGFNFIPCGNRGPADHHHRQTEIACGLDLRGREIAAGISGHHDFDAVVLQQRVVTGAVERSARHDHLGTGQWQRAARRIDQADQIDMLRMSGELVERLPPDPEKYPARRRAERFGRRREIVDLDPVIAGLALPRRTLQGQQRHGGNGARLDRVGAHLRGERVSGVDDAFDLLRNKVVFQAIDAAKAANTPGNRRRRRAFGAAGIRQYRINAGIIRYRFGEPVSVGGAAEDQDTQSSGQGGCHG